MILILDDALPFYNNFCSCMLGNASFVIFATTNQYVLLFAAECIGIKDCSEKLNYIPAKAIDKQLWCFAYPVPLILCN